MLDGYWQNHPSDMVKAGIMADWMDELEDWSIEQIRFGLRKWRNDNPSKKPNPSHISTILKKERGQAWVAQKNGKAPMEIFAIGPRLVAVE